MKVDFGQIVEVYDLEQCKLLLRSNFHLAPGSLPWRVYDSTSNGSLLSSELPRRTDDVVNRSVGAILGGPHARRIYVDDQYWDDEVFVGSDLAGGYVTVIPLNMYGAQNAGNQDYLVINDAFKGQEQYVFLSTLTEPFINGTLDLSTVERTFITSLV